MNYIRSYTVLFFIVFFISCGSGFKEFMINDMSLKLYENTEFTQEVRMLERRYTQKGKWEGSFAEGDTFRLNFDNSGLNANPEIIQMSYYVKNGNAVFFEIVN